MADVSTGDSRTLARIRGALLFIVGLGTIGMTTELYLINHVEDSKQLIPVILGAGGIATALWTAVRRSVPALRALQLVMLMYVAAGIIGIVLHFQANAEFQREMDPAIGGMDLFWKVVEATAPPALSPGLMVQLGLLGLVYTYRHPGLREEDFGSSQ
jgi:hypothetical protein